MKSYPRQFVFRIFSGFLLLTLLFSSWANTENEVNALSGTTWYVATTGSDANDCLSPSTRCNTINGVIGKAADGDTINAAIGAYTGSGSYVVTISKSVILSGGWDITFTTQNGTSTIDGGGTRQGVLVNNGITATIDRFVVQNGLAYSGGTGGGVINNGTLTINNGNISNNKALGGSGGGIFNSASGTLTLNNSIVSANETYYSGGGIENLGNLTIYNSSITGNDTTDFGHGGGVFNVGPLVINNSSISDNLHGGGIMNNGGTVTINNSSITGNYDASDEGGGIQNFGINTMILNNSTVSNNTSYRGGGVYNLANLILNNSTVSSNTGRCYGGGIYNNSSGTVMLYNSTISANTVGCYGGGIMNVKDSLVEGLVTLQNTILAGNTSDSTDSTGTDCKGDLDSAGYNLIGNNSGCTFTETTGDLVGTSGSLIDPLLGPLQNNGGLTFTHALLGESPARNTGSPAIPGSGGNACLTTDQRGVTRPQGSACDIGAYEGYTVVKSIKRMDPNPTTESSLNYRVNFTDPVTGVDITDFNLGLIGTARASITNVTGSGDTYTVTVNIGLHAGKIRLDVKDDDSIKDSRNIALGGPGAGNGDFTTGEIYTLHALLSLNSIDANDGWTLESREFSNIANIKSSIGTLRVGDDAKNRQYRSLLYFDTAGLPNNNITIAKVTVQIKQIGTDKISTLGSPIADMKKGFFGFAPLETGDFSALGAPINTAGKFSDVSGTYTLTLSPANFKYINLTGATQFRVRFTKDDDNDKTPDLLSFYSGNADDSNDRPQIAVEYYVP